MSGNAGNAAALAPAGGDNLPLVEIDKVWAAWVRRSAANSGFLGLIQDELAGIVSCEPTSRASWMPGAKHRAAESRAVRPVWCHGECRAAGRNGVFAGGRDHGTFEAVQRTIRRLGTGSSDGPKCRGEHGFSRC